MDGKILCYYFCIFVFVCILTVFLTERVIFFIIRKNPTSILKNNYQSSFLSIFYGLCYYSCPIFFFPLFPSALNPSSSSIPPPPAPLSSCPLVITYSSWASPVPILFLTSPSIFYLPFMLLIPCTFSPILPLPAKTFHVISISMILFLF